MKLKEQKKIVGKLKDMFELELIIYALYEKIEKLEIEMQSLSRNEDLYFTQNEITQLTDFIEFLSPDNEF